MAESSAVQGAKAGAAFGPWGSAIGAGVGLASDAVNGGQAGPFMGGDATSAAYGTKMGNTGWNVQTGGGTQMASVSPTDNGTAGYMPGQSGAGVMGGLSSALGQHTIPLLLVGAAVVIFIIRKRHK